MRAQKKIFAVLLPLMLAACTGKLDKLKEAAPTGDDFPSALASEYLAYGDSERELGHPFIGDYFAGKGLDSLKGKPVLPDEVKKDLPAGDIQTLTAARKSLVALRSEEMKEVAPRKLARAQMLFDCWQRQLITHTNQELAPCADEFSSSLLELQDQADSVAPGKETTRQISFAMKSAEIDPKPTHTLDDLAERAQSYRHYTIQIDGHIEDYAETGIPHKLALERMEAIRRALLARGVPDENIEVLRQKGTSHLAAVKLSSDKPRPQRSVRVTLRTYSAGEAK